MLGENLVGLTADRQLLIDTDPYGSRSTRSARLPGALVEDFRFALSGRPIPALRGDTAHPGW
jgi:hypothetical protein